MVDYGADPTLESRGDGRSANAMAARRGRSDVLALFERRGVPIELPGVNCLIAACARNDNAITRSIAQAEHQLVQDLVAEGGTLLARFAGNANNLIARTEWHQGIGSRYMYVRDADALHAELLAKGAIVQGDPISHPWGPRDFDVLDLDGNRLRFGQTFE